MAVITFTNGQVALRTDLVFGTVVLTEYGWQPVANLPDGFPQMILDLVDNNPTCPVRFIDDLNAARNTQTPGATHAAT